MSVVEGTSSTQPDVYDQADLGPVETTAHHRPTSAFVREIFETLLLTFFIFWTVNSLVGRYRIDGNSMNPTLFNGEYLIISNFAYQLDEPQRGDIIVFRHPSSDLNLIKRVIGLPGDTIEVQNGEVRVNGQLISEPYIQASPTYNSSWVVPEGQFFVLGDNRNNSSDSHAWGYLPEDHILGKALLVYWPPSKWTKVPHFAFPSS
ncbi:MAG TPA: signal peptidase I [Promineifilum sp.]